MYRSEYEQNDTLERERETVFDKEREIDRDRERERKTHQLRSQLEPD
jgi:hypothetical protein